MQSKIPAPMTHEAWRDAVRNDPGIPQTVEELRALRRKLRGEEPLDPTDKNGALACGTGELHMYHLGLQNPNLSDADRASLALEAEAKEDAAAASPPITSAHFVVNYTAGTGSGQVSTKIAQDASNALEQAYNTYLGIFGIKCVPDGTKCQVNFTESVNSTAYPNGPINLKCSYFNQYGTNQFCRDLTSYHEAFDLLQFTAGFTNNSYNVWFLEGTATWAELKYGSAATNTPSITGADKLTWYFTNQKTSLLSSKYTSLPFFVCFENYFNESVTGGNPMVDVIRTFRANFPSPSTYSVRQQMDKVAGQYISGTWTFEKLAVLWAARVAWGDWSINQDEYAIYPAFYDATHVPPALINIPAIQVPSTNHNDLFQQDNTWTSSNTIGAGMISLQQANFELSVYDPTKTWTSKLELTNYSADYASSFQYVSSQSGYGIGPTIQLVYGNLPQTWTYPKVALGYLIMSGFVSDYDQAVDYTFDASFVGTSWAAHECLDSHL